MKDLSVLPMVLCLFIFSANADQFSQFDIQTQNGTYNTFSGSFTPSANNMAIGSSPHGKIISQPIVSGLWIQDDRSSVEEGKYVFQTVSINNPGGEFLWVHYVNKDEGAFYYIPSFNEVCSEGQNGSNTLLYLDDKSYSAEIICANKIMYRIAVDKSLYNPIANDLDSNKVITIRGDQFSGKGFYGITSLFHKVHLR
ncbi:TPA: hypothetical protein ACGGM7_000315 [Escherichia coli]